MSVAIGSNLGVSITSPANGEQLVYNSATGLWENGTPAGGGDMLASVYDTGTTGVVDTAKDVSDSPLTTTTSVASQGGLLINIDSATGDIARTTAGWIEDEKYGWYATQFATSYSAEFDSAVARTGRLTLKLSTTDATGRVAATRDAGNATLPFLSKYDIPVKSSTKYRFNCFVKTNNVAASSAFIQLDQYDIVGVVGTNTTTNKLTGTNDWTLCTVLFTSDADATYIRLYARVNVAGNISDAWFDVNSMTLEEVVEPVANSLTAPTPSLVSFTAVGSMDNVDQSFTTTPDGSSGVGNTAGVQYMEAQSFTATKSKLTGVYVYKQANTGTPTGNFKIDIRTDNAGVPSATILATYTIPLATYNALSVGEFLVNVPYNLTTGTVYHIVCSNTATEGLNNSFKVGAKGAGGYTGGIMNYSADGGATWLPNGTADMYFKTLYYKPTTNFKASQNNSTVSISADEDGFLNGSIINLSTGIASFTESFGTYYLLDYTESGSDLIAEVNLPGDSISGVFTSDKSLTYSSDGVTYVTTFPVGVKKVWVKILSYSGFASFSYRIMFDNSLPTLRNYPTNKDIVMLYTRTISTATTSATYRATKFGFPAIEYTNGDYQFLNIDTTATSSVVSFSADGTSYTTVADGASIALTSTVNPTVYVKTNITANRIYLSSNDYNASSDKDGSNKMTVVYGVTSQGLRYSVDELHNEVNELKAAIYALQNP